MTEQAEMSPYLFSVSLVIYAAYICVTSYGSMKTWDNEMGLNRRTIMIIKRSETEKIG